MEICIAIFPPGSPGASRLTHALSVEAARSPFALGGEAGSFPSVAKGENTMSKATYHVPQPGEVIEFSEKENSAMRHIKQVAAWDSKHSTLTTSGGERYRIENRASIKPAEPSPSTAPNSDALKSRPCTEEHLFREPVAVSTEFTARLPTSFASEVERAQAIADAEVEEKRRKALFDQKATELDENLTKILHAQRVLKEEIIADYQDYQNRVDYLRSLRVRGK